MVGQFSETAANQTHNSVSSPRREKGELLKTAVEATIKNTQKNMEVGEHKDNSRLSKRQRGIKDRWLIK
jgi:hypothetical protein